MQGILSEASNSLLLCTILGGVALLEASVWEDSVPELWGQVLLATTLQSHTEAMPGLPSLGEKRWAHPLPLATIPP